MEAFEKTIHRRKNSEISSKRAASVHFDTDLDSDFDSLGDDHDSDENGGLEKNISVIQDDTTKSHSNILESHL